MLNTILTRPVTLPALLICLGVAMVLGVLTAMVFLYHSRHSAGFALTLALLPMAVTMVILLVNGNIGTGVAVAGTFALVRFRSIPGTAREIAAILVAMAQGLALGMGYIGIAVIFFALAAIFTLVLTTLNFGAGPTYEKQLKITIPENFEYDGLFDDIFSQYTKRFRLTKVRTTNMGTLYELTYDVMIPNINESKAFLDELRTRNGNLTIVIGDFTDKEVL